MNIRLILAISIMSVLFINNAYSDTKTLLFQNKIASTSSDYSLNAQLIFKSQSKKYDTINLKTSLNRKGPFAPIQEVVITYDREKYYGSGESDYSNLTPDLSTGATAFVSIYKSLLGPDDEIATMKVIVNDFTYETNEITLYKLLK